MPSTTPNVRNAFLFLLNRHHIARYQQQLPTVLLRHFHHHHHHHHLHHGYRYRPHRYQHCMQTRTREQEELLWEDLFSHPSNWLDCRRRKRTPLHPDFRHKTSKVPLWLNSMLKPHWVDPRLAVPGPGNPPEENAVRELCHKGELDKAMDALSLMDQDGFTPSDALYITILKACYKCKSLSHAIHINAHILRQTKDLSGPLQDALIITLAKCGGLVHAHSLLQTLPLCTVNSWTAVIDGFVEYGRGRDALLVFDRMQELNLKPTHDSYVGVFKACASLGDLGKGRWLHEDGERKGLTLVPLTSMALMDMYSKCGSILEAESVFYALLQQDILCWNAMLSVYLEHEFWDKAILTYRQMQEERWIPDALTYTVVLRACGFRGEEESLSPEGKCNSFLEIGKAVHADIRRSGFAKDVLIGSALIMMYGKCGNTLEALNVCEDFSELDIALWSAMLSAFVQQGQGAEALIAYKKLHEYGLTPDVQIFVNSLRACIILIEKEEASSTISLEIGQALHEDAQSTGCASNTSFGNTLVSMYGKCGSIARAENAFFELIQRDVVSWNAMLSVYIQHGQVAKALLLFRQMVAEDVPANALSFVLCFQACGLLAEHEKLLCKHHNKIKSVSIRIGRALHAFVLKEGHNASTLICNSLISMYGKCGSLMEAEIVFYSLPAADVVSWNAMLTAYVENFEGGRALQLFSQMLGGLEYPNRLTFVIALQACIALTEQDEESSKAVALAIGRALHTDVFVEGSLEMDDVICSTLVSLYGKCGAVDDAETIFYKSALHNLVLWNAMLSSYIEQGHDDKALHLLNQMEWDGMQVDEVTLICALQVCSRIGSIEMGRQLYFKVVSVGFDYRPNLINTLIHTVGHCASIIDAEALFSQLSEPYQVAWNAWIASYAQEGDFKGSVLVLQNMQLAGIVPDACACLSLLYSCSHAGLVEDSFEVFESMSRDFHLSPDIKHYAVMIDVLGRTGNFKKVECLLSRMPMQANLPLWLSLLGACRTHGNLELAKEAFKHAWGLQPGYAAAYVLLSNIHVDIFTEE